MDTIDQIVDRAIAYTRSVLARAPRHWDVARDGLERMRANLAEGAPDHPALERLEAYIADLLRYAPHGGIN